MTYFDINLLHETTKKLIPNVADLESAFTFFYDETNNIRKFYTKENNFNASFQSNFVLGGVVYDKSEPDIEKLFRELNLESSIKEIKLKHIAKGDFLSCLNSSKLKYFLRYLLDNQIYIHYSTINLLYYSIVDIVDSAYATNLNIITDLGYQFALALKNDIYKIAKIEIDAVVNLFYTFQYPNIRRESVLAFINAFIELFKKYENTSEFGIGLGILKQILKEAKKEKSLPFIMDEEDYILIKDFSHFYLRPLYLFKNSTHVFDKEDTIKSILGEFIFCDGEKILECYSFEDSINNLYIQASDIFVGLVGKLSKFINTCSRTDIENSICNLSASQLESLDLYLELVKRCNSKNIAFFHSIDSIEEISKLKLLYQLRNYAE
ncbi:hypothetical protein H6G27_24025 [Nostoc linckia FACHB-104]|nr:hypothetical protein [Nostoc linckia FACHB-104]